MADQKEQPGWASDGFLMVGQVTTVEFDGFGTVFGYDTFIILEALIGDVLVGLRRLSIVF